MKLMENRGGGNKVEWNVAIASDTITLAPADGRSSVRWSHAEFADQAQVFAGPFKAIVFKYDNKRIALALTNADIAELRGSLRGALRASMNAELKKRTRLGLPMGLLMIAMPLMPADPPRETNQFDILLIVMGAVYVVLGLIGLVRLHPAMFLVDAVFWGALGVLSAVFAAQGNSLLWGMLALSAFFAYQRVGKWMLYRD